MWLSGRLAPDFKTIADFRKDNGKGIRNVGREFIVLCRRLMASKLGGIAVTKGEYDRFTSKCYFFDGDPCVTSSGALHAEFDFHGKILMDMWDLQVDAEMLSHSIMATARGGKGQ